MEFKESILYKLNEPFSLKVDVVLRYQGRFCVPTVNGLRNRILEEAHGFCYSIHTGSKNMYHDLRKVFWLKGLKKEITEFVAMFPNCKQVKDKN